MKKIYILSFFLVVVVILVAVYRSNIYRSIFCNAVFYAPIFDQSFDPYKPGTTIEGVLKAQNSVEHTFFLQLDESMHYHNGLESMSGAVLIEFEVNGKIIESQVILIDRNLSIANSASNTTIWLHSFEFPLHGVDGVLHFKLTFLTPLSFPRGLRPPARCIVRPTYNPK